MAGRERRMGIHAVLLMIMTILLAANVSMADDAALVPAEKSEVEKWFKDNVKPAAEQKSTLDPALVTAEEGNPKFVKVMENGGDFKKISEAVDSIPVGNTKRVIIYIGSGTYNEKITIPKNKSFVTLFGDPKNMPNITFDLSAGKCEGTLYSATLTVESEYFMGVNLNIINSSPRPDGKPDQQAVALRVWGGKAALYNVKLYGFQDTLCDDQGFHFFKDCYIEGTVDFIFGRGKSIYLNTQLHVLGDNQMSVITAQAREGEENNGYSFIHCKITGTGNGSYLGRAWRAAPKVVFSYTEMSEVVKAEGWTNNFHPENEKTAHFGEYKNTGPGSTMTNRVKFTKELNDADAKPFLSLGFIEASKWLLPPPNPDLSAAPNPAGGPASNPAASPAPNPAAGAGLRKLKEL